MSSFQRDQAARIIRETAVSHRVGIDEILGTSRCYDIVAARHQAMARCYAETGLSMVVIGQIFGGRHHTTIVHAVQRMDEKRRAAASAAYGQKWGAA